MSCYPFKEATPHFCYRVNLVIVYLLLFSSPVNIKKLFSLDTSIQATPSFTLSKFLTGSNGLCGPIAFLSVILIEEAVIKGVFS